MQIKSPQISNEETIDLIKRYQQNDDIEARNQIIMGNIRLIFFIAHKNRRKIESCFEDFVSEGVIGMIEAINKFDTANYKNFSTYAYWHILKKVNGNLHQTMNIPVHRTTIFNAYEKEKDEMLSMGENPSLEEIADRINVSPNILVDTLSRRNDVSLDYGSSSDRDDDRDVASHKILDHGDLENEIATRLDFSKASKLIKLLLSEPSQEVLKYRFGLDGSEPLTLQETADNMHISTEYVRILQNKSINRLRKYLAHR